jgi:hypothetical protein
MSAEPFPTAMIVMLSGSDLAVVFPAWSVIGNRGYWERASKFLAENCDPPDLSTKHQYPSSKEAPNSKLQTLPRLTHRNYVTIVERLQP